MTLNKNLKEKLEFEKGQGKGCPPLPFWKKSWNIKRESMDIQMYQLEHAQHMHRNTCYVNQ